ncbi:MAG: hypothetical protein QHH26_01605 [Armatimonadota bacterium]|nr:hypothetical protein [Armatimonadota bacterium]
MRFPKYGLVVLLAFTILPLAALSGQNTERIPTVQEAINSRRDIWGELAMKQPNGPSYEFFEKLLPPLRYVSATFEHYPIVLCAPSGKVKARLVSNGSSVNALARTLTWRSEAGNPVIFYVGRDEEVFGKDLSKLDGPKYEKGYLPIVHNRYRHAGVTIEQEAFACVEPPYSDSGVVFLSFKGSGKLVALLTMTTNAVMYPKNGVLRNSEGGAVLWFGKGWKWEPGGQRLVTELSPIRPALLAVPTKPIKEQLPTLDQSLYQAQRRKCADVWEALLSRGMQVETPEPVVNNAWKALIIGIFELVHGDEMRYSAGNQYAQMYVSEGSDAIRAVLLWGYKEDARRMLLPLMNFRRQGLLYHQAGKKLQMLSHYYWLTRDESWFKEHRDLWMIEANRLANEREKETGLLPRERYCGDIGTPVYSLSTNANGWAGLRDLSAILREMKEYDEAVRLEKSAEEWLPHIFDALEKSIRRDIDPPFIPIALFGEEKPYDPLTGTRIGGYWDLVAPYILGSGIFKTGSYYETCIKRYLEEKGGLMMGMVRTHPGISWWMVNQNIDDLYTIRYVLTLLRRDEVDRALVSFYGKLAQGLTRDTFIGGEGTCPLPRDEFGRQISLPPNSASNAFFLWMLRYILIQDWDTDDDRKPDTLRLMFATPRRWMEDGKVIKVERAPTAFGEVSMTMTSYLSKGEVVAEVTAPPEPPKHMLIRCRLPDGWKVVSAKVGNRSLDVDGQGTVDITGLKGKFSVSFKAIRIAR